MKLKSILWYVIGLLSIILSICCFSMEVGDKVTMQYFGGDAYTGMQQASAHAANNVLALAKVVKFGFGSLLLSVGLAMFVWGVTISHKTEQKNDEYEKKEVNV